MGRTRRDTGRAICRLGLSDSSIATAQRAAEVGYSFELTCRSSDEAHIRALLLQAMARTAQIPGLGLQDDALEQLVVRLSLDAGVSAGNWAVNTQILE
jgi:hypothetical protein